MYLPNKFFCSIYVFSKKQLKNYYDMGKNFSVITSEEARLLMMKLGIDIDVDKIYFGHLDIRSKHSADSRGVCFMYDLFDHVMVGESTFVTKDERFFLGLFKRQVQEQIAGNKTTANYVVYIPIEFNNEPKMVVMEQTVIHRYDSRTGFKSSKGDFKFINGEIVSFITKPSAL